MPDESKKSLRKDIRELNAEIRRQRQLAREADERFRRLAARMQRLMEGANPELQAEIRQYLENAGLNSRLQRMQED